MDEREFRQLSFTIPAEHHRALTLRKLDTGVPVTRLCAALIELALEDPDLLVRAEARARADNEGDTEAR